MHLRIVFQAAGGGAGLTRITVNQPIVISRLTSLTAIPATEFFALTFDTPVNQGNYGDQNITLQAGTGVLGVFPAIFLVDQDPTSKDLYAYFPQPQRVSQYIDIQKFSAGLVPTAFADGEYISMQYETVRSLDYIQPVRVVNLDKGVTATFDHG